MMRLAERVALVTGGSRGIGRAVALAFAREGARVAVVAVRDGAALAAVGREIAAVGAEALALKADVTRRADVDQAVRQVVERWGRLDILVNNAGVLSPSRLEEIGDAQWQATLAVHLTGTFHCTRAVVPAMKAQGGGKIINVAAPSALRGDVGVADYAAAKGGIIAFTRSAAVELVTHNIQVNCVSPVAQTRMTEALVAFRRDTLGEPIAASRRRARPGPEAVAPAFVFFACADSDHVTGQLLAVDGGLTA
jgi:NAD(P)-dependent dehydrogenase (short-subunit alcohol dehydrogenase family)